MSAARAWVLGAALLWPALTQAAAGQVLFALGHVEIARAGQTLTAQRGTVLEVGDTISTGPTAFTQLRFKDGALLALRSGSQMTVEAFKLPDREPVSGAAAAAVAPVAATNGLFGGGRSILRLARGAFRTITGLIGKGPGDEYKVVTPAATIGIRGTDYSASYCEANCGTNPSGLFVGVSYGEITVNNATGQLNLGDNEYGYVKDNSTPPNQELTPPEVLETPITPQEKGTGGETGTEPAPESGGGTTDQGGPAPDTGGTDASTTSGATQVETPPPQGTYQLLPGKPGSYAFAGSGQTDALNNGVYTDDSDGLIGFLTTAFTSIGSAQNVNRGFDPATGLTWGRWSGGTTGGASAIDLNNQSLHWIYAFSADTPVIPISGSATYSLIGNTDPTDNLGSKPGFLGSATFSADFTNQTVSSTLNIGINSQTWQAGGSGSITGPLFSGSYSSVSVNGVGGGNGSFNGFFTNNAAGAGLSYSLTHPGSSATVSGTAAFGNPH